MVSRIARRVAAAAAGVALGFSPLVFAAVAVPASAAPSCGAYSAGVTTTTTLTLSPQQVSRGETFTATARVTSSTGVTPVGIVKFTYHGRTKSAKLTPDGAGSSTASVTFVAKSSGAVRAVYQGKCPGGVAVIGSSSSGPVILGVEASRAPAGNGGSGGVAGTSAGTGGTVAGLAATGADGQTELFGLLGAGMVVVGGLALVVHRRRVNA